MILRELVFALLIFLGFFVLGGIFMQGIVNDNSDNLNMSYFYENASGSVNETLSSINGTTSTLTNSLSATNSTNVVTTITGAAWATVNVLAAMPNTFMQVVGVVSEILHLPPVIVAIFIAAITIFVTLELLTAIYFQNRV
jgi:hypothetical protein